MKENAVHSERLSVLLCLTLAFQDQAKISAEPNSLKLVNQSFAALGDEDLEALRVSAKSFDRMPSQERKIWQTFWLDKIRRRGQPARLDEHINPAQITKVLRGERKTVRELILRHLPLDLGIQIAAELGKAFDFPASDTSTISSSNAPELRQKPIDDEIVRLVRRKFLSNFVSLENISEPTSADRFSVGELAAFTRQLGVRETAIACRGINSKEALAAFLGKFNETDVREIAEYIAELEKIRPFWVSEADNLVRQTLESGIRIDDFLGNLGLRLLADGFARREPSARRYAEQKMMPEEAEHWKKYLDQAVENFSSATAEERVGLAKRQRIFERLTIKSAQQKEHLKSGR